MKKIYLLFTVLITFFIYSQEAGKAGELLRNEMGGASTQGNEALRGNNPQQKFPNYQWNNPYSFGYAEVFIRIPEMGNYTIEIGQQKITNSMGKFRFFDLYPGNQTLSIYDRNFLVYRTRINIRNNTRMVLDYFSYHGLYLLGTQNLRNNYGNIWNDTWNNPYGNNNGDLWSPSNEFGNNDFYGNTMNDREFSSFIQALKKQSFDDRKLDFLKSQLRRTAFSTRQIKTIMKEFSFDKNRLEFAKFAYKTCVDKRNYYDLYDVFDFENYARQLNDYIRKQ